MNPDPAPLDALRADVRRFLTDASSPAEVRRVMATEAGYDPAVWRAMAESLHLQALAASGDWNRLAVVLEEMGRALLCAPFLSAVLAATALVGSGDDDVLSAVSTGDVLASVAVADDSGGGDPEAVRTRATPAGAGQYRLEGTKPYVLDGHIADVLIVPARSDDQELSIFLVDAGAPGLVRTLSPTMDQTRKLATIELSGTPARLLGMKGRGGATLRQVLQTGTVALAAEQLGGAQRCLDITVDHARTRHQFGRPIGSFQAVKHTCANMLVAVESARSAAGHAVEVAARSDPGADLAVAASLAKVCCSEAYFRVAADTIQVHGALGFSWDHDAHLYFKRATSSQLLFGDPTYHRRLLAERLGI